MIGHGQSCRLVGLIRRRSNEAQPRGWLMPNTNADPSQVQELERSRRFYDATSSRNTGQSGTTRLELGANGSSYVAAAVCLDRVAIGTVGTGARQVLQTESH
jgi:hypothetical protein